MANITALQAVNFDDFPFFFGTVTVANETTFQIETDTRTAIYTGTFTYDVNGRPSGQLDSYVSLENDQQLLFADELNTDIAAVLSFVNAQDAQGLTQFALQQDDIITGSDGGDVLFGYIGNDRIDGGDGNDTLRGDFGSDTIFGGAGDDTILGGNQNDVIYGGDGSDLVRAGGGNDIVVAGTVSDNAGTADTAFTSIPRESWVLEGGKEYAVLTGPDGERDKYIGFDFILFGEELFELPEGSALDSAGDPTDFLVAERVALLYEAALNRDGNIDLPGLNFYISVTERDNLTDEFLAQDLMSSPEFTANFGDAETLSNEAFLEQIYLNVLDRPSDDAGRQFYLELLDAGTISKALALADIAISPENTAESASILINLYENSAGEWAFL